MTFLGADTEALRDVAKQVGTAGEQVDELMARILGLVQGVEWTGPDADSFCERARSVCERGRSAAEQIRGRGEELTGHAEEQDEASSDGGGGRNGSDAASGGKKNTTDPSDTTDPADEGIPEDAGSLDPKNSAQGQIGDCYLLSSLQSIAQQNPGHMAKHVEEVRPGVYRVILYDERGKPVPYEVTGVQEAGVRGADGDQTLYSVYEQAYKQYLDERGIDMNGGFPEDAMQTLTGADAKSYDSDSTPSLEDMRKDLDDGKLINADTGGNDDPSHDNIVGNHAYTVSDVDPGAGTVTVTNPWGGKDSQYPKEVTMTYEEYRETFGRTTVGKTDKDLMDHIFGPRPRR